MTRFLVNRNRVENDFDKLFNGLFNQSHFPTIFAGQPKDKSFSPNVNVVEHDDSIALTFELPGMEKSDIKVMVKDNLLTVSGDRKIEVEAKTDEYVCSEISSGSFSRSFNLPDTVMHDNVNADYKNGLLHVVLSKKEEIKPKEIEINIS